MKILYNYKQNWDASVLNSSKISSDEIYLIPHDLATAMCCLWESNQTKFLVQYDIF